MGAATAAGGIPSGLVDLGRPSELLVGFSGREPVWIPGMCNELDRTQNMPGEVIGIFT